MELVGVARWLIPVARGCVGQNGCDGTPAAASTDVHAAAVAPVADHVVRQDHRVHGRWELGVAP